MHKILDFIELDVQMKIDSEFNEATPQKQDRQLKELEIIRKTIGGIAKRRTSDSLVQDLVIASLEKQAEACWDALSEESDADAVQSIIKDIETIAALRAIALIVHDHFDN